MNKLLTRLGALALAVTMLAAMAVPGVAAETQTAAVAATIPADGDPSNETAKGSYTVSDEEVLAAKDTVIATLGEYELTVGQLQIYYWMEVQDFLYQYGSYAPYFGLDYTQDLDVQACMMAENGATWQQFFLASALNTWRNYQAMGAEAEKSGFVLSAEMQEELDNLEANMDASALYSGLESGEAMLKQAAGQSANMEDYLEYVTLTYNAMEYFDQLCEANLPTDAEIEAYFTENEEAYAANGLSREDKYVTVRHVLLMPEGADSSNIRTETFDEEAWKLPREESQKLLEWFETTDMSEETFAQMAVEYSQDGSAADGGIYTDITKGQMVENFENWCFDPARQAGDCGIVETEFGCHLMYYVSDRAMWPEQVESELTSIRSNELLNGLLENYTLEADFPNIVLGYVNLAGETEEGVPAEGAEGTAEDVTVTYDNNAVVDGAAQVSTNPMPVLVIAVVSVVGLSAAALVLKKKEEH